MCGLFLSNFFFDILPLFSLYSLQWVTKKIAQFRKLTSTLNFYKESTIVVRKLSTTLRNFMQLGASTGTICINPAGPHRGENHLIQKGKCYPKDIRAFRCVFMRNKGYHGKNLQGTIKIPKARLTRRSDLRNTLSVPGGTLLNRRYLPRACGPKAWAQPVQDYERTTPSTLSEVRQPECRSGRSWDQARDGRAV